MPAQDDPERAPTLAEVVAHRRGEIVRQFEERAQRQLREGLSRSALVDSMPGMLDVLAELLRASPTAHAPDEPPRVVAIAWAHGAERAATEIDVVQLIWEYGVLRDILLDEAERAGAALTLRDVRVLTDVITTGIAESVRKFTADRASELRRTEARFLAIADHAPAAFVIKSADGRLIFVNRFVCEALGRKRTELVGRLDGEVLPPAAAARQAETDARAMAGETVELRDVITTPRGLRSYYMVKFRLPRGPGQPPEIAAIGLDVTELEAARATVHHADELLELGDAFFELDRDWRYVRVNRNQERLSRRPREETIGRVFWDLWPEIAPDHPYWIEYHRVMEERVPREFDAYFAPLDLWTSVTAYPVSDGGIAVFFRDATRRKRVEERLRQMQAFQQQLIGIVSHDLRNPLNVVLLGSAALLTRGRLSEPDAGAVARIRSAAQRAARLISDLLDVTRARLGEPLALRLAEIDLANVARQVLEELRSLHPDRELRLDAAGETTGRWDPDRVAQVIENLVVNAVKYGQAWSPVRVRLAGGADEVLVSVNNRGEPIPPEAQRSIFEPGARAANGDPTGRSVGLGLFIVERITAAHGGRVEVESSSDEGTTFTVHLPRRPPATEPAPGA